MVLQDRNATYTTGGAICGHLCVPDGSYSTIIELQGIWEEAVMALSKLCLGVCLKKRQETTTSSQNSCVVGGVQTGRLLNTCLALYRSQVGSTAVLTDYPVQTLGLVLLGCRRWRKVDVVCSRIGVVDDAGGGLRRRMALEGLELAGAPDASVEELVLLSHAIFLSLSPPYSFLQCKEAGPY